MSPAAEILLFSASRSQHVAEVIRPQLERDGVVLCDRFADSTLAYQGYGRGLDLAELQRITAFATGGLTPDLTVCLDLPAAEGLGRKRVADSAEWNRMEQEQLAFHERVRAGYHALAIAEPARWVVMDAAQPVTAIQGTDSRGSGCQATQRGAVMKLIMAIVSSDDLCEVLDRLTKAGLRGDGHQHDRWFSA